jgi:hypothetical protein
MLILLTNACIPAIPIDTESGNHTEDLLEQYSELAYDEERFLRTCTRIGHEADARSWMSGLTPLSTMRDALKNVPKDVRQHLLKVYIADFSRTLVV